MLGEQSALIKYFLVDASELDLDLCLASGQTFTWRHTEKDSTETYYWYNMIRGLPLILCHQEGKVYFYCHEDERDAHYQALTDYFRLGCSTCLTSLYREWAERDKSGLFSTIVSNNQHQGIRLLDQCRWECMLAFVCSQNNAVGRITKLVRFLVDTYGRSHQHQLASTHDGADKVGCGDLEKVRLIDGHTLRFTPFPTQTQLQNVPDLEQELRDAAFGYRAKYIAGIVENWKPLYSLSPPQLLTPENTATTITEYLQGYKGIGRKVADCIALMSYSQLSIVPIDTHMRALAIKYYKHPPSTASRLISTPTEYKKVSTTYTNVFGEMAGWAHLILFAAQLGASGRKKLKK